MTDQDIRAIDRELGRLLAGGAERPGHLALNDHRDLWSAFTRSVEGGKRFRPALLIAAHRELGGHRHAAAIQVGAAIELLHTAFVVQDDVIDGDLVRRGVPNLSGTFAQDAQRRGASPLGARRYGDAAGILGGDLGLLAAFRAVTRCDAPAPVIERLLDLLESTVHASAAGELADVRLQLGVGRTSAALEDALAVAELKTAVYSFQLPLHAGALLADATPEQLSALDEIGGLLGIGFQLFDDLLGVFGEESRTGKSNLGDLREGKRTALLAHASTTPEWSELQTLVGRDDLGPEEGRRARALLTRSGSRAWTEDLARWHLTTAVESAARHTLPATLVAAMRGATETILCTADRTLLPLDADDPAPVHRTTRTGQPA